MIANLGYFSTDNTDPYLNLAMEEYLTMHTGAQDCNLFLWQNERTVVVGRNQNCWKECRVAQLEQDGGHLVRRLSGGGAVFHDMGNLNFTFCVRKENYNVDRQLRVIAAAMRMLGIPAEKTGRNDITADGRKFSGNAFYDSEGYCYHHGTLLVDVNKEDMTKYLNVPREKLQSKGVESVRSRVVNLKEFVPELTIGAIRQALRKSFEEEYNLRLRELSMEDFDLAALDAARQRFASWDWIYGRKIPFQYSFGRRFSWGDIELEFLVDRGIIRQVNAFSDGMRQDFVAALPRVWQGCRYEIFSLVAALGRIPATEETEEQMRRDLVALVTENI